MPETTTERPWLAELTTRYGPSRIAEGPVKLRGEEGDYERECWVWFPGGENCNVALDRYARHWMIRAGSPHRSVVARIGGTEEPGDREIRAALVLAGLLEAGDA